MAARLLPHQQTPRDSPLQHIFIAAHDSFSALFRQPCSFLDLSGISISLRIFMRRYGFILLGMLAAAQAPADLLARFRTAAGDIIVQLYEYEKPVTVGNFVRLVEADAYRNTFFHRCEPDFIVQGGGFITQNPASTNLFELYGFVPHFGPITNEYAVGRQYSNVYGTIAMAKLDGNPDSATSQWFFNLGDNSSGLNSSNNGGYTVFGRVVSGFNVLQDFNSLSISNGIVDLTQFYGPGASAFRNLPVIYSGHVPPHYNELIYVNIHMIRTENIAITNGLQIISWTGATGLTNHLETTGDMLSGNWTRLLTTNATGAAVTTVITNPPGGSAFYRICVEIPSE